MPLTPVPGQRVSAMRMDIIREHVLEYYDGPRMILLEEREGTRHLSVWNDESDGWERWLLIETGDDRLEQVLRGDMSLREAILNPEAGFIIVCDLDPLGGRFPTITTADQLPEESLPAPGATMKGELPPGWRR